MAGGRPTAFRPEYVDLVRKFTLLGATDEELANFFGVTVKTLFNWGTENPEFLQARKEGKLKADAKVAYKLHSRATGYRWTEQQAIKLKVDQFEEKIELVEVEREVPPETTAAIFWLKNRRSGEWRDKIDVTSGGKSVKSLFVMLGPDDPEPPDE
jgi:hypothetical protein